MSVKIAVVGCGDWGRHHVRTAHAIGVLAAFCDSALARQAELSHAYKVPYRDFEDLLEMDEVGALVLATPASTHYELTMRALEAGKHVFVEKPLSHSSEEISNMQIAAAKRGLFLMPGHLLLYHPAFQELTVRVQAGTIGKPQMIVSRRANFGKIYPEESVLWDLGPHDISMILTLLGEMPTSVTAQGVALSIPHVHDAVTLHLTFQEERKAFTFLSRVHPQKEQILMVQGPQGAFVFDDTRDWASKLIFNPTHIFDESTGEILRQDSIMLHLASAEPLKAELIHFIKGTQDPKASATEAGLALQITQVLEAADRSLETNTTIFF